MNNQFPAGSLIVTPSLIAHVSIAILLTGEEYTSIGVLLFVLLVWLLFYKLVYKSLGNVGLVRRVYFDVTGALERIKDRVAEGQTPRREAADRRVQVLKDLRVV